MGIKRQTTSTTEAAPSVRHSGPNPDYKCLFKYSCKYQCLNLILLSVDIKLLMKMSKLYDTIKVR